MPTDTPQTRAPVLMTEGVSAASAVARPESFLPSLATRYLSDGGLPARRRLATLFVDIAGSTRLLEDHAADAVLAIVQRFMHLVTDVALAYCGDVKDFEGDGALLYFESTAEASQAALAIRDAIAAGACGTSCPVSARMSLTVGEVVIGLVGTAMRQSIALVGTSVHIGARLLKHIPPGGIIASAEFVGALRAEQPPLADQFLLHDQAFEIPGADRITVTTYAVS
jgi:class 3 adenylate cyclase